MSDALFRRKAVAAIEASQKEPGIGNRIIKNLPDSGSTGSIYPINSKAEEICGLKAYKSIPDVPSEVDVVHMPIPARGAVWKEPRWGLESRHDERAHVLLSRKEANILLEIVDAGLRSHSEEDLRQLVLSLQNLIPFEFAMCVLSGISCSSADPHRIINVSYPVSWLELYISEQFDRVDPIVAEHRLHFDLQYWSDSYRKHPGARQFISCASVHRLKTGYSYGLRTESGNSVSLFSFGGRSMKECFRTCDILRRIVPHLHQALVRIVAPKENRRPTPDTGSLREKRKC